MENWWNRWVGVAQANMQVHATPALDCDKMISDFADLGCDVVIFNAGGIYALYPTTVPYHTLNPFMNGRGVLGEVVDAAHKHGVKIIGRVDFSLAMDSVYGHHPEWFAHDPEGQPIPWGEPRPGNYDILYYYTCLNSPYRNEAVAIPVLERQRMVSERRLSGQHFPWKGLGFP